jgi:hypothetical protein
MSDLWSEVRKAVHREQETWPVELRFLCQSLARQEAPEPPGEVEELPPIDWDEFLTLLARHRLLPLAPYYLHRYRDVMPAAAATRLRQSWQCSRLRSLALAKELASLLNEFQLAGIRSLSLKGPLLAQQLFGDPTARMPGDLDLLVHPEDLGRTVERLSARGYRSTDGYPEFSPRQQQAFFNQYHHFGFKHPQRAVRIELHWRWFNNSSRFNLRPVEALAGSRPYPIWGVVMQTLSPNDTLLYLCAHGAQHLWYRLSWIRDIASLLKQTPTDEDWPKLLYNAERLGVRPALLEGVSLAGLFFGCEMPEKVVAAINRTPCLPDMIGTVCRCLAQPGKPRFLPHQRLFFSVHRHMLALCQTPRAKAAHFRTLLRSQMIDWQTVKLPPRLFFLYHLLRPVFWLQRHYLTRP